MKKLLFQNNAALKNYINFHQATGINPHLPKLNWYQDVPPTKYVIKEAVMCTGMYDLGPVNICCPFKENLNTLGCRAHIRNLCGGSGSSRMLPKAEYPWFLFGDTITHKQHLRYTRWIFCMVLTCTFVYASS